MSYSQSFETRSKDNARFRDRNTLAHDVNAALIWNVPLHACENFQGHGYLKGMNGASTKQYARGHSIDELLIQVIGAHKDIKSINTFDDVDYTESIKEAKCIVWIPLHNDGEGIYELRRGDIISDFQYERQKAAKRNLTGLTTFVFDIDRFEELGDFGFTAENEVELNSKLNKQFSIYYDKELSRKVHSGGNFQEHPCLFERNTGEKYPLLKIRKKKIIIKKNTEDSELAPPAPKQKNRTYKFKPDLSVPCCYPFAVLGVVGTGQQNKKTIRAAYKEAVMRFHPDKGGNEVDFKKIQAAYNNPIIQQILDMSDEYEKWNKEHGEAYRRWEAGHNDGEVPVPPPE